MKLPTKTRKYHKVKKMVLSNIIVYSSVILMLYGFIDFNSISGKSAAVCGATILSIYFLIRFYSRKKMQTLDKGLLESLR